MSNTNSNISDIQNLIDAGCSPEFISEFNETEENQEYRIQLLYEHRDFLLIEMHKVQRKIDCLDFFIVKNKRKERYKWK